MSTNKEIPSKLTPVLDNSLRPDAQIEQEKQREQSLVLIWEGYFAKNYRYAPYNPDALIASKGYDAIDAMKTMAAYISPLTVLYSAVLHKNWSIKPAVMDQNDSRYNDALEIAKAAEWHLRNITDMGDASQDVRQVSLDILNACHIGFSLQEIEWRYVNKGPYSGQWGFKRFSPKRAKQIGFDLDPMNLAIRNIVNTPLSGVTGYGVEIPLEKCILYTFRGENALPYGRGLSRACYKHYWILDTLEMAHAIAMERFATPGMYAKVPQNNQAYVNAIRDSIDEWRMGGSFVVDKNVEIELIQAATGSFDTFVSAKRWHAEQMAQVILLQQLTTNQGTGVGSYALGEVHEHTQNYLLSSIRTDLEHVWTRQVLQRWTKYNYGEDAIDLCPRFDLGQWDAGENKIIGEFLTNLIENRVVDPLEPMVREKVNLPPVSQEAKTRLEEAIKNDNAPKPAMVGSVGRQKKNPSSKTKKATGS